MNDCVICLEKIENESIVLKCNHSYHKTCIEKIKKPLCPLCNANIEIELGKNGIMINTSDSDSDNDTDDDTNSDYDIDYDVYYENRYFNEDETIYIQYLHDTEFIENFRSLSIRRTKETIDRAYNLYQELKKYDLKIRNDSILCENYIVSCEGSINDIVDTMRFMDWLFKYTDYRNIMKSRLGNLRNEYYNVHNISESVKTLILEKYIKQPVNFRMPPPDTNYINSRLKGIEMRLSQEKIVLNWRGNLKINIYDKLGMTHDELSSQVKERISNYISNFASNYVSENEDKFLKNELDFNLIKEMEEYKNYNMLLMEIFNRYDNFINSFVRDYTKTHYKDIVDLGIDDFLIFTKNDGITNKKILELIKDITKRDFNIYLKKCISEFEKEYYREIVELGINKFLIGIQNEGIKNKKLLDKIKETIIENFNKYLNKYTIEFEKNYYVEIVEVGINKVLTKMRKEGITTNKELLNHIKNVATKNFNNYLEKYMNDFSGSHYIDILKLGIDGFLEKIQKNGITNEETLKHIKKTITENFDDYLNMITIEYVEEYSEHSFKLGLNEIFNQMEKNEIIKKYPQLFKSLKYKIRGKNTIALNDFVTMYIFNNEKKITDEGENIFDEIKKMDEIKLHPTLMNIFIKKINKFLNK